MTRALRILLVAGVVVVLPRAAAAYSVLAHESNIDALWDARIRPLLLAKYPRTTPDALMAARAYAYGGSVIHDLGYYPFGSRFFTNVVHYARTGDFVELMLRAANDVNEYAFAIGALCHYAADNAGHAVAVNKAVPLIYPKMQKKFGDVVPYDKAPKEHILVEFAFDVLLAAHGGYKLQAINLPMKRFVIGKNAKPKSEGAQRATAQAPTRLRPLVTPRGLRRGHAVAASPRRRTQRPQRPQRVIRTL